MKQLQISGKKRPDKNLLLELLADGFDSDQIAASFPISEKQIYEALGQWVFDEKKIVKIRNDVKKAIRLTEGRYFGYYCNPSDPITKTEIEYNKATTRTESTMKMWYYDRFILEAVQSTDHNRAVANCKQSKKLDPVAMYLLHYTIEMIRSKMNSDNKKTINKNSETLEDILHNLFLECFDSNDHRTKNALQYQMVRASRKK